MRMIEKVARAMSGDSESADDETAFADDPDFFLGKARAAVQALMEPSEEMSIAGLNAWVEAAQKQRDWWIQPEQQERDVGEDTPLMPVQALLVCSSEDSDSVVKAALQAILDEKE